MTLKHQAASGFIWNAVEKFSAQFIALVIGVTLARILTPEDFGLMGMLVIFTSVATAFVDSGMGSGLVQQQDKTDDDYATVFVFNIVAATAMYLVLFAIAPYVAAFYQDGRLTLLLRIVSLNIPLGALLSIQRLKLQIALNFKALAKVNLAANALAGIAAILVARSGVGYWALAVQLLCASMLQLIFFMLMGNWRYRCAFSKKSFDTLFSFGSKLLFASLYAQALRNVYNVFIGKYYSSIDLGYYTRAIALTELVAGTVTTVIDQVTYPLLSALKADQGRMVGVFIRVIRMAAFINFPAIVLLSALAKPIVLILLTDKWEAVIPLLQWMAFGRILFPLSVLNFNLLNANGRSDIFLKVDLSKLPLAVIAMVITIPMGVKAMVIGQVVTSFLAFFINTYMPGKLFHYGALAQLGAIKYTVLNAAVMFGATYFCVQAIDHTYLQLIVGAATGCAVYLLLAYLQKSPELEALLALVGIRK